MTDVVFATILHYTKFCIEERHLTHHSAQAEVHDARAALHLAQWDLECVEYRCYSSLDELHQLEASMDSMREKHNFTRAETSDPGLTEATDVEI